MSDFWKQFSKIGATGVGTLAALILNSGAHDWSSLFTPQGVAMGVLVLAGVGTAGAIRPPQVPPAPPAK